MSFVPKIYNGKIVLSKNGNVDCECCPTCDWEYCRYDIWGETGESDLDTYPGDGDGIVRDYEFVLADINVPTGFKICGAFYVLNGDSGSTTNLSSKLKITTTDENGNETVVVEEMEHEYIACKPISIPLPSGTVAFKVSADILFEDNEIEDDDDKYGIYLKCITQSECPDYCDRDIFSDKECCPDDAVVLPITVFITGGIRINTAGPTPPPGGTQNLNPPCATTPPDHCAGGPRSVNCGCCWRPVGSITSTTGPGSSYPAQGNPLGAYEYSSIEVQCVDACGRCVYSRAAYIYRLAGDYICNEDGQIVDGRITLPAYPTDARPTINIDYASCSVNYPFSQTSPCWCGNPICEDEDEYGVE